MANKRRALEGRWATFSGAILGITVFGAALSGSDRRVFLAVVALMTILCIYGFLRTFAPLAAIETVLARYYKSWKLARHPYITHYQRFSDLNVPDKNNVYLFRISGAPPGIKDPLHIALKCEITRLSDGVRAFCTNQAVYLDVLATMDVPQAFLETRSGVTVLCKGKYVIRWLDEADNLLVKKRITSQGFDVRKNLWRRFKDDIATERYALRGATPGDAD